MKPYYEQNGITIYHGDCRQIVPMLGAFDLLLTDPPYGIGESSKKVESRQRKEGGASKSLANQRDYGSFNWDTTAPPRWVLDMLRESSEKQILWGGNYYEGLPAAKGWLVWDKQNGENDFADCELAWTNLPIAVRMKQHLWNGMLRKGGEDRFHPTQKPLELMLWCIALAGDVKTILDPYCGSGTTGRAAKDLGKSAVLIDLEEKYCELSANRLSQEVLGI